MAYDDDDYGDIYDDDYDQESETDDGFDWSEAEYPDDWYDLLEDFSDYEVYDIDVHVGYSSDES